MTFAIIINWKIDYFTDTKPNIENINIDDVVDIGNIDTSNFDYKYDWNKVISIKKTDIVYKEMTEEEKIIQIQTNFQYKVEKINQEFNNEINQFTAWYSQAEIDSWKLKEEEANKVLLWETSDFLNNLCIEWETVEDLANKIIKNAWLFKTAYANAEKTKRQKLKDLNKKNNS